MDEIKQRPVEDLKLSEHTVNILKSVSIITINDALLLIYDGPAVMRDVQGLGAVEIDELMQALREKGVLSE